MIFSGYWKKEKKICAASCILYLWLLLLFAIRHQATLHYTNFIPNTKWYNIHRRKFFLLITNRFTHHREYLVRFCCAAIFFIFALYWLHCHPPDDINGAEQLSNWYLAMAWLNDFVFMCLQLIEGVEIIH